MQVHVIAYLKRLGEMMVILIVLRNYVGQALTDLRVILVREIVIEDLSH